MSLDEKQQLAQAKRLIEQKRYDEARLILEGLTFNTTAQRWLSKLDEIAPDPFAPPPASKPPARNYTLPGDSPRPQTGGQGGYSFDLPQPRQTGEIPSPNRPADGGAKDSAGKRITREESILIGEVVPAGAGNPIRPWRLGRLMIVPPVAWLFFAANWRRLGRPWGMETVLGGVLVLILSLFPPIFLYIDGGERIPVDEAAVPIVAVVSLMINLAYTAVVAGLQGQGFKQWQRGGMSAMLSHRYDFLLPIVLWGGGVMIVMLLTVAFIYNDYRPRTYEDAVLTMTYGRQWESRSVDDSYFCRTNYAGCFAYLTSSYATINFAYYPLEGTRAAAFERDFFELYDQDYSVTLIERQDLTIAGYPAVARFFSYDIPEPGRASYGYWVHILTSPNMIGAAAFGDSRSELLREQADILEVLNSITFKGEDTALAR